MIHNLYMHVYSVHVYIYGYIFIYNLTIYIYIYWERHGMNTIESNTKLCTGK